MYRKGMDSVPNTSSAKVWNSAKFTTSSGGGKRARRSATAAVSSAVLTCLIDVFVSRGPISVICEEIFSSVPREWRRLNSALGVST